MDDSIIQTKKHFNGHRESGSGDGPRFIVYAVRNRDRVLFVGGVQEYSEEEFRVPGRCQNPITVRVSIPLKRASRIKT